MEKLNKLCLLESQTNIVYEVQVTSEVYDRASKDMVFATKLLERRVYEGRTVFKDPLENFEFVENTTHEFSSSPGPSTAGTSTQTTPSVSKSLRKKKPDQEDIDLKSGVHNWTKEEVLLLIATYKEHQLAFLEENAPKADLWSNIVNEMATTLAKHGLPSIDAKKCKTKMDTLKRHYKNLKDSNKKSGNSKITWPYYDEMDELFGEQPWVQPLSTAGSNIPNEIDAVIKSPPPKRQKTLKDYCNQLVIDRKERVQAREQHHKEKIAAMNCLTDVVAQLISQTRKDELVKS